MNLQKTSLLPAPKLPEVVYSEPENLLISGQCSSAEVVASLLGSSSPLSSVVEMNAQTARALSPGRRILIR